MSHKTHTLASAASWSWYVCEKKSLKTAQKSWHNSVILTVKQKQQASVTLHHHCQNNMSDPKHILHRGKDCQRQGGRGGALKRCKNRSTNLSCLLRPQTENKGAEEERINLQVVSTGKVHSVTVNRKCTWQSTSQHLTYYDYSPCALYLILSQLLSLHTSSFITVWSVTSTSLIHQHLDEL